MFRFGLLCTANFAAVIIFVRRKCFCERLEKVVTPFARRTIRLEAIELLAFALGARAAARTTIRLGFQIGNDFGLRVMRRRSVSINRINQVSIRGVDDFAFRRRISYRKILVELESHTPIRTADTLSNWLAEHPDIQIVRPLDRLCRSCANGCAAGCTG